MTVWTADELRRVGDAGELRIAGRRIDDACRRTSGIGSAVRAITSDLAVSTTLRVDPA